MVRADPSPAETEHPARIMLGCVSRDWQQSLSIDYGLAIVDVDATLAHALWLRAKQSLENAVLRFEAGNRGLPYRQLDRFERKALTRAFRGSTFLEALAPSNSSQFYMFDLRSLLAAQPWIYNNASSGHELLHTAAFIRHCLGNDNVADAVILADGSAEIPLHSRWGAYVHGVVAKRVAHNEVQYVTRIRATPAFMRVVHYGDEFVLINGHHRAFELLKRGHTYGLCVVDDNDSFANVRQRNGGSFQSE